MKIGVLGLMCLCATILSAQQPGQRLPGRPGILNRLNRSGGQPQPEPQRLGRPPTPPAPPVDIDLDNDGVISEQEIYTAVTNHLRELQANDKPRFFIVMKRFDKDKDGQISLEEALEIHAEITRRRQQGAAPTELPPPGERPPDGRGDHGEKRVLSDNGLLKGIKINGLNISSDH
jgi:hypothetical protein